MKIMLAIGIRPAILFDMKKQYLLLPLLISISLRAETPEDLCTKNFETYGAQLIANPKDEKSWDMYRACTDKLKKWESARQVAQKTLAVIPQRHEPWLLLGITSIRTKDYEKAIEELTQAVQFKPDLPITHFYLGMAYLFINKAELAVKSNEKAAELDPKNVAYRRALAYAHLKGNSAVKCEESAMKALEIDPNDEATYKILAQLYGKLGRQSDVNQVLSAATKAQTKSLPYNPLTPKLVRVDRKLALDDDESGPGLKDQVAFVDNVSPIALCAQTWEKLKKAALHGEVEEAASQFTDYANTRQIYREAMRRLGPQLQDMFAGWGDLYDCETVLSVTTCKATVQNAGGQSYDRTIRFEKNPDKQWRIRSL